MKRRTRRCLLCGVLFACALPQVSRAAVFVSEIMYDVSGSDASREWIEIANDGASAVDLAPYRFFENGTNHPLTLLAGSGVLAPQGTAIVALDEEKFRADNPSFSGMLFKASFSLSNTGETVGIKDSSLAFLDSVSYDASAGAAGDGNSLHRSSGTFIAGAPTPGSLTESLTGDSTAPQTETDQTDSTNTPTSSQTQLNTTGSAALPPPMTLDAGGDRTVESAAGSFFDGHLFNKDGVPMTKNVRFLWNFGNGETREGQSVFYAYPYPGTYSVVLTADAGNGYSLSTSITVEAVPAEVFLSQGEDGSLAIANRTHAGKKLDLGLWVLERDGVLFTIPRGTVILPGKTVRFSPEILKMPQAGAAQLRYPSGKVAASSDPAHDPRTAGITYEDTRTAASRSSVAANNRTSFVAVEATSTAAVADVDASIDFAQMPTLSASADEAAKSAGMSPLFLSAFGLAALVIIGVAGVLYGKTPRHSGEEGDSEGGSDADGEGGEADPYARADACAREFAITEKRSL